MSNLDTRVSISDRVVCRDLGGEAIVMDLDSGTYYGLDEIGFRMWTLLGSHRDLRSVSRVLLAEYEVQDEQLNQDLLAFVDHLASRKLLTLNDD